MTLKVISIPKQSRQIRVKIHFGDFWNIIDALAIILFFSGLTLRCFPIAECFCMARIILSFDLILWFARSLSFFAALKQLGPKLVMISEMVNNNSFFDYYFLLKLLRSMI